MKFFDQINSHQYLDLAFIGEPEENSFSLVLAEAKAYGSEEDIYIGNAVISGSRPVGTISGCCIYKVKFDTYICYTVTNESYAIGTDW